MQFMTSQGGEGQWAILSATSQAANQNAWIEAMQNVMESDEKYANLELVDIVYGDDEPQPSTEQTQALLQNYPGSETDLRTDNSWYQRGSESSSGSGI